MSLDYLHACPDYLVLGHVTKDVSWDGQSVTPGGTVLYAALTAQRLGLQAAIATACASEDERLLDVAWQAGVWVHTTASPSTTTFYNIYDQQGKRTQIITSQASSIWMRDVPSAWRDAPIVHLGPVAQELPDSDISHKFGDCLLGVTPQGWMRRWDNAGLVSHSAWPIPQELLDLPANAALSLSIEDLGFDPALVERYIKLAPLVAVTYGADGAYIHSAEQSVLIPACHAEVGDPTGAGDVFAAALFVRYGETGDMALSARFAHAAAACAIEGPGTSTIPDRAAVEVRSMKYEI